MASPLTPRQELLQIQKRIFRQNQEVIRSQTAVQERGFEAYERCYRRHVRSYASISSIDELMEAVLAADIIYLGDYHTNKQSQRMLLRLMKLLVERTRQMAVGIEIVQKRHQKVLENFLKERITEETFLKKVGFQKFWYFDLWENFKPIFDFSRYWEIPLYGFEWSLSGDVSLDRRDNQNARTIASLIEADPERKWIIFVGDLHMAPSHLPDKVQRFLKSPKRDLILYQNSEEIYWRLAGEELEDKTEIVRIDKRSFCLMNTPPIVSQQSYLNWLEHEEGTIDYADVQHSFSELVKQIAGFLEIPLTAGQMEEVEVFTCGDLSFLARLEEDGSFSRQEIRRIKRQILASESYCIPQKKYVYLANLSLNHAAEEASHYLKFLCSGSEFPRSPVDAFYANVLHEALGFFGSKIINQKRKCFHEREYEGLIKYLVSAKGRKERELQLEMALLILDHKKQEKKGTPIVTSRFFKSKPDLFFGVTHGLGYMLGDHLFYALLAEKISKKEIRDWFCDPMKEEGAPFELYMKILRKMRGVRIPKRV